MFIKSLTVLILLTTNIFSDTSSNFIKEKSFIATEKIILNLDKTEKILDIKQGGTIIQTNNRKTTYTETYYLLTTKALYRIDDKNFNVIKKIDLNSITSDVTGFYIFSYFPNSHGEDKEHIYLADNTNKRVVKIDEKNNIIYLCDNGILQNPIDIDVSRKQIRILDRNKIIVLNSNGKFLFTHNGSLTGSQIKFSSPTQIWSSKFIYDKGNHRIRQIYSSINDKGHIYEFDEGCRCNQSLPKQIAKINKSIYLTISDITNKQLLVFKNTLYLQEDTTYIKLQREPFLGVKLREKNKILIVYANQLNTIYLATMKYDTLRKVKHFIEDLIPDWKPGT